MLKGDTAIGNKSNDKFKIQSPPANELPKMSTNGSCKFYFLQSSKKGPGAFAGCVAMQISLNDSQLKELMLTMAAELTHMTQTL
ncbi:hypothetical protein Nepgr_018342 [Nepenthes gracilis]|uniref:Uncharacterized protein n=1 Tax=Nepenthes gracilis TaxID=150966 RepID=A0AAD3XU80_NEPGR|nr:hypothetical protein Nepgr_018342 [Nepenthes gracilis]